MAPTAMADAVISERRPLRRMFRKAILKSIIGRSPVRCSTSLPSRMTKVSSAREISCGSCEEKMKLTFCSRCILCISVDDLLAGVAVEIGGRLVGQHDLRMLDQRAGDGDALFLAAGELVGPLAALVGQADGLEHRQWCAPARSFAGMPISSSGYSTFS